MYTQSVHGPVFPLCVFITVRCVSLCCSASHLYIMHHLLDGSNGSLPILKIGVGFVRHIRLLKLKTGVGSVRHIWLLKKLCSALNCGLWVCSTLACFCYDTYSRLTFCSWQQFRCFILTQFIVDTLRPPFLMGPYFFAILFWYVYWYEPLSVMSVQLQIIEPPGTATSHTHSGWIWRAYAS